MQVTRYPAVAGILLVALLLVLEVLLGESPVDRGSFGEVPSGDSAAGEYFPGTPQGNERRDSSAGGRRSRVDAGAPAVFRIKGRVVRDDGKQGIPSRVTARLLDGSLRTAGGNQASAQHVDLHETSHFDLIVPVGGEYQVWAQTKEVFFSDIMPVPLSGRAPCAEIVLRIPRSAAISGKVIDGAGDPVPGAKLMAFVDTHRFGGELPPGIRSHHYWGRPSTVSRQDGSFILSPVSQRAVGYVVQCMPPRMSSSPAAYPVFSEVIDVPPGSQDTTIEFPGAPGTRCELNLRLLGDGGGALPDEINCKLMHMGINGSVFNRWNLKLKTDSLGLFTISRLLPGACYRVAIVEPYLLKAACSDPVVVGRSGVQEISLEFPSSQELSVEVTSGGRPATGVAIRVIAFLGEEERPKVVYEVPTASSWPRAFRLLPGRYRIDVFSSSGKGPIRKHVEVGRAPLGVVMELPL
jgi:hypothetical protein